MLGTPVGTQTGSGIFVMILSCKTETPVHGHGEVHGVYIGPVTDDQHSR